VAFVARCETVLERHREIAKAVFRFGVVLDVGRSQGVEFRFVAGTTFIPLVLS
jgi:hypothetical protein